MFVWFHYVEDQTVTIAGNGSFATEIESGRRKSAWKKMVRVWNEMVDSLEEMMFWVQKNSDKYPDFNPDQTLFCKIALHKRQNLFGL